ncbi:MAG: gfo/Idh/MocA family oxidoreductase, partial [Saprospiraceae bacterium]
WVNGCMKGYGNAELSSSFDYAGPFTEAILLGVLAMKSYYIKVGETYPGRSQLVWDAQNMKFTNLEVANQLVHRVPRKGWEM